MRDTIKSIIEQTYTNWEAVFVDDASTDDSVNIIKQNMIGDYRIISLDKNTGVANARNIGLDNAKGRFICFLDADDIWFENKIRRQVEFMTKYCYSFTFTDYEYANTNGRTGKTTNIPKSLNYKQALKNTTIFTSTVMIDTTKININDIKMPNVPYEDTATWWSVLKKYEIGYGLQEVLSVYRTGHKSLSSNKLVAIKRAWNLYRNVEGFSVLTSFYYFLFYSVNAFVRRNV